MCKDKTLLNNKKRPSLVLENNLPNLSLTINKLCKRPSLVSKNRFVPVINHSGVSLIQNQSAVFDSQSVNHSNVVVPYDQRSVNNNINVTNLASGSGISADVSVNSNMPVTKGSLNCFSVPVPVAECKYNNFDSLKFAHKNVNNLSNKVNFVAREMENKNIDIFAITETWLMPTVSDAAVAVKGYDLYRKDSVENRSKHGVCCYVKSNIKIGNVNSEVPNTLALEMLPWKVYVVIVYRPPSNNNEANESLRTFIGTFCPEKEVIILGDFNLPSLKWNNLNISEHASPFDHSFLNTFTNLSLTQWIDQPTFFPSSNILDLVLTSESDRVLEVQIDPPFPACHHALIVFSYLIVAQDLGSKTKYDDIGLKRDWYKGNYKKINIEIKNVEWDYELAYLNTADSYTKFLRLMQPLIRDNIPVKKKSKGILAPWERNIPKDLEKSKKDLWARYKQIRTHYGRHSHQTQDALNKFFVVNQEIKDYVFVQHCSYEEHLISLVKSNPKPFHSYIRSKKRHKPSIGPLKIDNKLNGNEKDMSECLVTKFQSVFVEEAPTNPAPHQEARSRLTSIHFTTKEVENVLKKLNPNTSMGPDGLHPHLLRECSVSIASPIHLIAEKSMIEGSLPMQWKVSNVTPIFKKGAHSEPLNYRPVSLTSVVCKAIERIVVSKLNLYLEENKIINEAQFGFQKGKSVEEQLLLTYNDITHWYDCGYPVDLILFDFAKAFDTVNHDILIQKLFKIGIRGNILDWLRSFLRGRKMSVVVAGIKSNCVPVTSGVPQGSVVGPILFIIFVNHLMSNLINKVMMFADDMKLYIKLPHSKLTKDMQNAYSSGQEDVNTIVRTSLSWGLKLNSSKCVILRFRRNFANMAVPVEYTIEEEPITEKEAYRDLGILLDCSLKFHDHIRETVFKANGTCINLLKSTVCRTADFMVTLFVTHIRPILDFCSTVWSTGYVGDVKALENVQRRWTKKVTGLENESYGNRLRILGIFSIQGRLLRSDLVMCWKIFNGKSNIKPSDLFILASQAINTRGHKHKIFKPRPQTEVRSRFFSVRVIELWNKLSADTVNCSTLPHFKSKLAGEMEDKLYAYTP